MRLLGTCCTWLLASLAPAFALADAEPDWLVAARAREGTPSAPQRLESSDKAVSFTVPARVAEPLSFTDGAYSFGLDIGSAVPMSCEISAGGSDLAAFLEATSTYLFSNANDNAKGTVEAKAPEAIDAGAVGGAPFMAVNWVYRIKADGKPRLGVVKQAAANRHDHTVYCSHDDVGYARSFAAAFRSVVDTLAIADAPAAPRYLAIDTVTIGGQRVGVQVSTLDADADGDLRLVGQVSLLLRTGANALSGTEEATVQWVRPDGALLNGAYIAKQGAEITSELRLEPAGEAWSVSGRFQGKDLEQQLPAGTKPDSALQGSWAIRDLVRAPEPAGKSVTSRTWVASVDPFRLLDITTTLTAPIDPDRFGARQTVGSIAAEMVLDRATGDLARASLPIGPQRMELERVHTAGRF